MENIESNVEVIEYNVNEIMNYQDIIQEIRTRITLDEQGLTDEVRELVQECKDEIVFLRTGIENLQQENMEVFKDNCTMAKQLYINEKLLNIKSETKRKKIKKLLLQYDDDVKFIDQKQIDNIFNIVLGEKE